jgi:hypothetical protein
MFDFTPHVGCHRYTKLNRLSNASPVKSESEATEQYNAHNAEINKIADDIQNKIRKDFPNNHSVIYTLQHFDECHHSVHTAL